MVFTLGLMEENTKDNGTTIICMVKGGIHGRMEDHTKVNIIMTKNMVSGHINGQMEGSI